MRRKLLLAYFGLLLISHLVAWLRGPVAEGIEGDHLLALQTPTLGAFQLNYQDRAGPTADAPTLVLLHGSPGHGHNFDALADALQSNFRVLIPDLPGFGGSTRALPSYSISAHAEAVDHWMQQLAVDQAHFVGFSMGGGVALELYQRRPQRMQSLTMLSAIGVQELELLGHYDLNHAVHGLQLLATRALQWLVPHFGSIDRSTLIPYARNFYDSDQRPLRGILQQLSIPTLIIHGNRDFLVPVTAAKEHHRLVPQSQLVILQASHFLPWSQPRVVAEHVAMTVNLAEKPAHIPPPTAARISAAAQPWTPTNVPPYRGAALVLAMLLIALATLVSEDLTCIATGLLVAQSRIGFFPGVAACFLGILIGDGLLFLAGRWLGQPALQRAPLRWFVKQDAVHRARTWFHHRGSRVILLSRFMPGMRLPTYVAAGVLGMKFRVFFGYFALAGLLWTPLIVGISTWAGREAYALLDTLHQYALPGFIVLLLSLLGLQKLIVPMFSHRGRRLLYCSTRRKIEWEFWPTWLIYLPVSVWILGLAVRYRGLRTVTAVNPGIATGGLLGESKWDILQKLAFGRSDSQRREIPPSEFLPATLLAAGYTTVESVLEFMQRHHLQWPLILKPERGERGKGVQWLRNQDQLQQCLQQLTKASGDTKPHQRVLIQQSVHGEEFGLFYWRAPDRPLGTLYSINGKDFPKLRGDGQRTLEQLILDDDRAVRMASVHFAYHADHLFDVPADGKTIDLVDVGAHSRGTIFLDRRALISESLRARLDQLADSFPGFHFGRFDVIAANADELQSGKSFKILELNGLTAEAAHIYQPGTSIFTAWRTLMHQWQVAYQIGHANRRAGARPSSWKELWRAWRETKSGGGC